MEVRNQEHLAETAGLRIAPSAESPLSLSKWCFFAQNGHYLAYNGDLKGKKWAGVGASKNKTSQYVLNVWDDFCSQSVPVHQPLRVVSQLIGGIPSLMHIPSGSRPLYITEILRQGETSPQCLKGYPFLSCLHH